jgi:polysaccharide export outer membrane protein
MSSLHKCIGAAAVLLLLLGVPGASVGAVSQSAPSAENDYRLGPNDKLRVITFGEESLTGEFFISGSGRVSLPLIGEIEAAGLTAAEFQQHVEAALKDGYLKDPKVSVEVISYRPYYILGEVGRPGEYPYTNGLTVLNAVATANGFTYRANTHKVFVRHAGESKEQPYTLESNTPVKPGDTVRILERYF